MRILLKLSGEALAGDKKTGFDEETVRKVALQVKELTEKGTEVGIVIGGGNFWRGRTSESIDRVKADHHGRARALHGDLHGGACRPGGDRRRRSRSLLFYLLSGQERPSSVFCFDPTGSFSGSFSVFHDERFS